jgi:hypothetical protein
MNTILALILVAAPAAESESELPGLAVLDLQIKKGVESSAGEMLNDLILDLLGRSGRFSSVIAGSDIREMISMEQQKQALGCDDDSCLAELGGSLGVPLMFTSSLGAFGGKFIINLKLISVEEATVKARASRVVNDEAAILEALPAMLEQVQLEGLGEKVVAAKVAAAPAATEAETEAIKAPTAKVEKLVPAAKAAKVTKKDAKAAPASSQKAPAKRPLFKRPMAYLGLGSTLAGVVVGVALNSPERGSLQSTYDRYRAGERYPGEEEPMTSKEFGDVVRERTLHNIVGAGLGSVGVSMILYSMIWGR